MNLKESYQKQLEDPRYSEAYHQILANMSDEEMQDSFYKDLSFGTAGIRGKVGAGPNRMSEYVIRKVSYAMAKYLSELSDNPSCAIAYDSRNNSEEFSQIAAATLAAYGVKVYRFSTISATPELSFTVRYLKTTGGVVITASHNPPEYSGYKIYHSSGRQMLEDEAGKVTEYYLGVEDVFDLKVGDYQKLLEEGMIEEIGPDVRKAFDKTIADMVYQDVAPTDLSVVYTPLHGVGKRGVLKSLESLGVTVYPVPQEIEPDGNFPIAHTPNPEDPGSFSSALEIGHKKKADLLVATDPDVDRVGIMVYDDGDYVFVDGNSLGVLMMDYLAKYKKRDHGQVISTVVSTLLIDRIAEANNLTLSRTLTGFKYMGELMNQFEKDEREFIMSFEESFGYCVGDHVRDKDAISAVHLVAEMAAYYKKQGKTLLDRLQEIYDEYGYYLEDQIVFVLEGQEGMKKIQEYMKVFRKKDFNEILGRKLLSRTDYQEDETPLPKSNVMRFIFEDDFWFAARPSGTEPKLKIYMGATGQNQEDVNKNLKDLMEVINDFVGTVC